MRRQRIVAILACLIHLQSMWRAYAAPPIVWAKPYALVMDKGIRIQKSDTTTTCNAGAAGSLRNNAGTLEACNGTAWAALGGSSGGVSTISVGAGLSGGGTGAVTLAKLADSKDAINCAIFASVASSAMTVQFYTSAGATPSATDPCTISFRNLTAANAGFTQVNVTSQLTAVIDNGSSLGCTTSAQCFVNVYAANVAGVAKVIVGAGQVVDEGSLQDVLAIGSTGTADASHVLYGGTAATGVPVRYMGRISEFSGVANAWTAAVSEISNGYPKVVKPWYVIASEYGCEVDLGTVAIAAFSEMVCTTLSLKPFAGSAPAGIACANTSAAATPTTAVSNCGSATESIGLSFQIPEPGTYQACVSFGNYIGTSGDGIVQNRFDIKETASNNTAIITDGLMNIGAIARNANVAATQMPLEVSGCTFFDWSNATANSTKTLRAMVVAGVGVTVTVNKINADIEASRSILWRITKL